MDLYKGLLGTTFHEELPGESFPWQTVTELIDDNRVLIENHRGVTAYSCDKILVRLPGGRLCITGNDLCIACMTRQRLIIKGIISGITICKER